MQQTTERISLSHWIVQPYEWRGEPTSVCGDYCRMRWTVRGIPRVPWNAEGVFDGVSTFRLDREGKIFEHQASIKTSSALYPSNIHPTLYTYCG